MQVGARAAPLGDDRALRVREQADRFRAARVDAEYVHASLILCYAPGVSCFTLFLAVGCNLAGVTPHLPKVVTDAIHALGVCAIPLGLIMTGVSLANFLDAPRELFDPKIAGAAALLRLGVLPVALILLAKYLPCSVELKRVILVQAAMPVAMVSVIHARLYGGHTRTAVQIVLGTTAVGIFTIPLWIRAGLAWVGV